MNVKFRFAQPEDAAAIVSIYGPFCESSCVSFELVSPSEQQMRERITRIMSQHPWLVGELDGRVVGYAYATQHRERAAYRWAVDVAIYLAAEHHRQGWGRGLYDCLIAILAHQGFFKAIAGITLPNPSSVGLHEAIGFRPAAVFHGVGYKMGRWLDVGWWELEVKPEVPGPPEPRAFPDVRDDAVVANILETAARRMRINLEKRGR
jgi:phosphinothricin acetyltransferase